MRFRRKEVIEAYPFDSLREAPKEFAEAVCYADHGSTNPERKPHMHAHISRSGFVQHICDGYWLYRRDGLIYAMDGETFAASYEAIDGGAA